MCTCLTGFLSTDISAITRLSREGDCSLLKSLERDTMEGCQSQMNASVGGDIINDLTNIDEGWQ